MFGMNAFGTQWCGHIFTLHYTSLKMAVLLHKTALSTDLVQIRNRTNEGTVLVNLYCILRGCVRIFKLQFTSLKMAVLLHKIELVNFPMATTVHTMCSSYG